MSGSSSYTVSARLQIGGNYQAVMRQLGRSLSGLDQQIMGTERHLVRLAGLFPMLARVVATSTGAASMSMAGLRTAVASTSTVLQAATRSVNTQTNALNRNASAASRVATAAHSAASAMRALASVPPPPPLPPLQRRGGGGGGAGGNRLWQRTNAAFATAAAAGAPGRTAALAGAYFGYQGIGELLSEGGKLQSQMVVGREQVGPQNADWLKRLRARSEETTNLVPGTTTAGNVRAGMAIGADIKDREEVLNILPTLQRMAQVLATVNDGTQADGAAAVIARYLSLRGSITSRTDQSKTDLDRYRREAELLERNLIALRDLKPSEFVGYQQQARSAGQNMTEQATFGGFTAAGIMDMGGHRFGTGTAGFARQFSTGIMTKEQAAVAKELGIVGAGAKGTRLERGELDSMLRRGDIDDETHKSLSEGNAARYARRDMLAPEMAGSDPEAWRRVAIERMQGRKYKGQAIDMNDPRQVDTIMQALGGTAVVRGYLSWLFDLAGRQANIQRVQDQAPGAGARILSDSYDAGLNSMSAGFRTLLQAVGESGELVKMMNAIGQGFRDLAAASTNQGWVDQIVVKLREFWDQLRQFATDISVVAAKANEGLPAMIAAANQVGLLSDSLRGSLVAFQEWAISVNATLNRVKTFLGGGPEVMGPPSPSQGPAAPGPVTPELRFAPIPGVGGGGAGVPALRPGGFSPMPGGGGGGSGVSPLRLGSFSPMPGGGGDTVIHNVTTLDGRVIAENTTRHQSRAANGATQSSGSFDSRRPGVSGETVSA